MTIWMIFPTGQLISSFSLSGYPLTRADSKLIMNCGLGGGGEFESETTTKSVIPSGMSLIPASARRIRALTCASASGYHG